jgi:hypothetical protein
MRAALRAVLLAGTSTGLDLNFAGGVFSLNNTRTASPAAIPGWSFSRTDTNGVATALDLAGNVIQFATGVPRITNRGILVEEARTNVLLWSQEFDNAYWGKTAVIVTANVSVAPDGTTTADRMVEAASVGQHNIVSGSVAFAASPSPLTASVFFKRSSGSRNIALRAGGASGSAIAIFNGETGAFVSSATTGSNWSVSGTPAAALALGGGWFWARAVFADTEVSGSKILYVQMYDGTTLSYSGDGSSAFDIWQADLQAGAFATSPIITTGAAGTRGAENAFVTGLAGLPPFTFFTEGDAGASGFPQYGGIDDGTSTNRVVHLRVGSANNAYVEITSGGGSTGANVGPVGVVFAGQTTKIASSVTSAGLRASRDGSAIATAARTVNALNRLCVGNATGTLPANGYIRRIRILPTTSTDAQLQALTS